MSKFYLTTAIPYVNSSPHAGHALEFVQGDVVARFHRLLGDETLLLTGADENALKNVQAAEKLGITPQELCDRNSEKFKELLSKLNIPYDVFQRGSDKKLHWPGVAKLWELCFKNGDIYKKTYAGLYCIGCELYYTEGELVDGLCPEHKTKPELVLEENYFFRLSKYQDKILSLIESNELLIIPDIRRNEILSFIKSGLSDFSVSRSVKRAKGWGVPVPNDPEQIIYVWFDALDIYMTGIGFGTNEEKWEEWWPADLHIIGKGITRFHAVYWIAILLSAGLPLPKSIFVHGYITSNGEKMSKSLGNVINPFEFINKYGADAVRYYLLKEIPAYSDGDFSERRFFEVYNADLASGLGNLVSRVLALVQKNSGGRVPSVNQDPDSHPLRVDNNIHNWKRAWKDIDELLPKYKFNEALESIWKFIGEADNYIDKNEPWKLANKDKKEFNWVVYGLLDAIHQVAWQVYPFMPGTALETAKRLGVQKLLLKNPLYKDSWTNIQPGTQIEFGSPLFPRI